jgi:hypothetical protein
MSQVVGGGGKGGCMYISVFFFAVRALELAVFICLPSGFSHMTEVRGP